MNKPITNIYGECALFALNGRGLDDRGHGISIGECQCCGCKDVGTQDYRDFHLTGIEYARLNDRKEQLSSGD